MLNREATARTEGQALDMLVLREALVDTIDRIFARQVGIADRHGADAISRREIALEQGR